MLTTPLPSQIDIRKLVVKGAEISVNAPVSSLPRVSDLLADTSGVVEVKLEFYVDEERFRRVDGTLGGTVKRICQRCLEPMDVTLNSRFQLAIVWSEEDAERLPKSIDPLIVGEELVDLADIVSEELILSLPFVSYHDPSECKQQAVFVSEDASAVEEIKAEKTKPNPFQVLEQLKFDK